MPSRCCIGSQVFCICYCLHQHEGGIVTNLTCRRQTSSAVLQSLSLLSWRQYQTFCSKTEQDSSSHVESLRPLTTLHTSTFRASAEQLCDEREENHHEIFAARPVWARGVIHSFLDHLPFQRKPQRTLLSAETFLSKPRPTVPPFYDASKSQPVYRTQKERGCKKDKASSRLPYGKTSAVLPPLLLHCGEKAVWRLRRTEGHTLIMYQPCAASHPGTTASGFLVYRLPRTVLMTQFNKQLCWLTPLKHVRTSISQKRI